MVEPVFAFLRREFFHQRQALGVGDVSRDLPAQGAMADGLEARLERLEYLLLIQIGELLAEAFQVAEGVFVYETHQTEQFQQGILQGRRREQQLVLAGQCQFEGVGDDVRRLVDVAQPVRFVDHHQVPRHGLNVAGLALGELIGTDDDFRHFKRTELALPDRSVIGLGFENPAGQEEFFGQLLKPLLAQVRGSNDQNAPLPLRPLLRQHEARLDGLAQAHLIGEQGALG